jgi:hypothetical protein
MERGRIVMKKNQKKDEEQKQRHLTLNRETIRSLNDPALLELARGGEDAGNSDSTRTDC